MHSIRLGLVARLAVLCLTALAPVTLALMASPPVLAARPPAKPAARANAPAITVIYPDAFATSAPLSLIAAQAAARPANASATPVARPVLRRAPAVGASTPPAAAADAMLDQPHTPAANMPGLIANFEGMPRIDNVYPPDPNGDIGYDPATGRKYYFQWLNLHFEAWDVTDPLSPVVVLPATAGNALWASGLPGSQCALHNDGDPIALFDEQAHRWFISQFEVSSGFHQCVAVSQTADPAGAWYLYDYPYLDGASWFNDYPKFGVWPDPQYGAYYMTVNQFNSSGAAYLGVGAAAFDRQRMLAGDPSAALIVSNLYTVNPNYYSLLPVDLDGPPPPAGTPGLFLSVDDDVFGGLGADAARIWEFRPNWASPAGSTFGINGNPNYTLPVASFSLLPCTNCIPQPGTTVKLDALGDRAMYRAALRDFGGHQSLVVNETVLADGVDRAGVRWYEFRRNPGDGSWSVAQQSTYAPADGIYRWMGSAAMDRQGNLAIGYSAGSSTLYPSIRYAGRLVSDTLSTLPQGEMTMTAGSGYQSGQYGRWGDYSMMGIDPQDGCTFWYTNEYIQTSGLVNWQTRIGSFTYPACTPYAVGSLTGIVTALESGAPLANALVVAVDAPGTGVLAARADAGGAYRLIGIPIGSYTVTAAASGRVTMTMPGVLVSAGVTATQDAVLTKAYGVQLAPAQAAGTADPGAVVAYTLAVTNTGGLPGTFSLTVSGNAWPVLLPASVGPLLPGASVDVAVAVTVPAGAAAGAHDVVLLAATSQTSNTVSAVAVLTTTANTARGVVLLPSVAYGVMRAGYGLTYTLVLTNTGNVTDTYALDLGGNTWPMTLTTPVGPLAGGQSASISLAVSVPSWAAPGTIDVATLTATSLADGTVTAASVLTTAAATHVYFVPIAISN